MFSVWSSSLGRSVGFAALALLVSATCAAVGLLLTLPSAPPSALAWRLPLLLAALALGGTLHVDGPVAGHVSALASRGLLGPPDASGSPTRHLTITAMPLTLTVITAIVVGWSLRGADRLGPLVATVAGCFAVLGLLLAVAARTSLPSGTLAPGLVATPIGAAVLGGCSAAVAVLIRRSGQLAAALRIGLIAATGLLAVGVLALLVVALANPNLGAIDALLVGGPMPPGLTATLGLLLAPALIGDVALLGLGVPLHFSGALGGFSLSGTATLLDAARSVPVLAFAPVLALATLLTAGIVAARRDPRVGTLATAGAFGVLGLVVYGLGRFGVDPRPAGGERAMVAAPLWAAVLVPAAWGAALGTAAPRLAALFAQRPLADPVVDRPRS